MLSSKVVRRSAPAVILLFVSALSILTLSAGCGGSGVAFNSTGSGNPLPVPTDVSLIDRPIGSVSFVASQLNSGSAATAIVNLQSPPDADQTILLSSSNPAAASVPSSVVVHTGNSGATFIVTAGTVSTTTSVTITVTNASGGQQQSFSFTVTPPSGLIRTIHVANPQVVGGNSVTGTITLDGPAVAETVITLNGGSAGGVSLPPSVSILIGSDHGDFTITTSPVAAPVQVTIGAKVGDDPLTATVLTVTPN